MTQSPTRGSALSSKETKGKASPSTLMTARSVNGSRPISRAFSSRSSFRRTVISSAFSTTWLLVTMKPSAEMKKPEPAPAASWVLSSSPSPEPPGAPGTGTAPKPGIWIRPRGRWTRVFTSICTTAGATCWKMSAKLSGAPCGGAKAKAPAPAEGTSCPTLAAGAASAPGQVMTPPAVAAAAKVRPTAAPRMNSLRFSIVVLAVLTGGYGKLRSPMDIGRDGSSQCTPSR
ncbi:hypothetical protein D3C77_494540 [compost metagenome]